MIARFLGDFHGSFHLAKPILGDKTPDTFIQCGDLAFNYDKLKLIPKGRAQQTFWAIHGNHDALDKIKDESFFLGNYGMIFLTQTTRMFYVSGGFSIDYKARTPMVDWWPNEQLTDYELSEAFDRYCNIKPEIVVSHEAPVDFVSRFTDPWIARSWGYEDIIRTRTSVALQQMFNAHQPKYWVCGHYHTRYEFKVGNTEFTVLDMLREGSDNKNAYRDFIL